MANKHHAGRWEKRLDVLSSILKLATHLFRAVFYFQLSFREFEILADLSEFLAFLTSFV